MIDHADVVIIGSGGLGAATAYYLAKRGGVHLALLDKHEIGSQTSPRAAGMVSCLRKSDLMIDLIRDACRKIETFSDEVGQPLAWMHSGSLKVARRPEDATVLAADLERGRRKGLDVEPVSAEEAHRLNPFFRPTGVAAVLRIDDDRYFDPAQVAVGFARGAETRGAALLSGVEVTGIEIDAGKVTGVQTSRGSIRAPVVVDATGAWTRQVAEASGPLPRRASAVQPGRGCSRRDRAERVPVHRMEEAGQISLPGKVWLTPFNAASGVYRCRKAAV